MYCLFQSQYYVELPIDNLLRQMSDLYCNIKIVMCLCIMFVVGLLGVNLRGLVTYLKVLELLCKFLTTSSSVEIQGLFVCHLPFVSSMFILIFTLLVCRRLVKLTLGNKHGIHIHTWTDKIYGQINVFNIPHDRIL